MTTEMEQKEQTGGNTKLPKKRSIQSKRWVITWHGAVEQHLLVLKDKMIPLCKSYVFAAEEGASEETPHIQGAFILKKKARFESMKILLDDKTIHFEKMKGNWKEASDYCFKEGNEILTNVEAPYKVNIQLRPWQKGIIDIIKEDPDDRTINWFWEPRGCAGKTVFQKYLFTTQEHVICLSGKASDMKHAIIMYEEKNDRLPRVILINIPRTCLDYLSYTGLEEIKDMMFFSGKYEGGMVCGASPHVICFANSEPYREKMSQDRWNIVKI